MALGLVGDPEVIFLDESNSGFDPAARRGGVDFTRLNSLPPCDGSVSINEDEDHLLLLDVIETLISRVSRGLPEPTVKSSGEVVGPSFVFTSGFQHRPIYEPVQQRACLVLVDLEQLCRTRCGDLTLVTHLIQHEKVFKGEELRGLV